MKALMTALVLLTAAPASAQGVLNRGNGGEPESLDPAFTGSAAESNVLGDMMVGLTTLDAAARPIPGIASRWETSPDGLNWTFHLRPARWSDGKPVVAGDFVFSWRRLLNPKTGSRNAQLMWIVKNARAINSGALPPTALGVTAPDAATLKVALDHPAPYLPELLTNAAALPLPPGAAKAGWTRPGAYVSNGPYLLKAWIPGDHVALAKNPRFYDAASVRIEAVNYYPTTDTEAALRRLRAGELDMQTPLPSAQIAWLRANMPDALHILPSAAIFYVSFNLRDPLLKDIRVRRALNLVFDREAVARKVMKLGETPAYSLVPPGITGYGRGPQLDFKSMPMPARVALARQLMQQAGYGPARRLRLNYATTANPDSKRLAAVFQAMARQAWVDLDITTADYPLHLRNLRQGDYQLGYASWLADFDDAGSFLDLLRSGVPSNYAGYRNRRFDAAMAEADRQADPARRAAALRAAEGIALADLPWLPARFPPQSEAVGSRVGGYIPNSRDFNRSRWLWLRK